MVRISSLLSLFLLTIDFALAHPMVKIPKGELRAIWLAPVSTEAKKDDAVPTFPVDSFEIMKFPVTREDFTKFLKGHPEWKKENANALFVNAAYLEDWKTALKRKKAPMTSVSWFAAKAYCESLGMRLPTVNEWEYVAAASEKSFDANKDPEFLKRILEWYGEPKSEKTKDVGSIYENIYGVWDMHGLIWEWVDDFNSSFVTGESRQDTSMNKDMFCGAGAISSGDKENYAAFMRFAFRSGLTGRSSVWNLGFRCVRDL